MVKTAPSPVKARAVANPMPAVEPVTRTLFPFKPRSIAFLSVGSSTPLGAAELLAVSEMVINTSENLQKKDPRSPRRRRTPRGLESGECSRIGIRLANAERVVSKDRVADHLAARFDIDDLLTAI
jgi:hypothetical protein